eukprot:3810176-Pleurochrysis_carterae.AAC.1
MSPSRARHTLPGARGAGCPAPKRGVCLPYALPGSCLRGAHVWALAARRISVPQAHAPLLA